MAAYFGVHQKIQVAEFITPQDLVESDLEFADIDAPFVEDERPNLDALTKRACWWLISKVLLMEISKL